MNLPAYLAATVCTCTSEHCYWDLDEHGVNEMCIPCHYAHPEDRCPATEDDDTEDVTE